MYIDIHSKKFDIVAYRQDEEGHCISYIGQLLATFFSCWNILGTIFV